MSLMRSGTGHARVSSSVQLVPALGWADAWPNQLEVILPSQSNTEIPWAGHGVSWCVMVSAGVHMSSDSQGSQASQE